MQPETQYYKAVKASERKPPPEVELIFIPEEEAPVFGRFRTVGKTDYVILLDSSGEEEAYFYKDYAQWLEPIPLPDAAVLWDDLLRLSNLPYDDSKAGKMYTTGYNDCVDNVREFAREALSQTGDGWIRMDSGRLPTEMQYVLVCINEDLMLKGKYVGNGKWSAIYSDGEQVVGPVSKVTAWQPLPSPPKP